VTASCGHSLIPTQPGNEAICGQYNTHGAQQQLNLLQGMGSLLTEVKEVPYMVKGHCSLVMVGGKDS